MKKATTLFVASMLLVMVAASLALLLLTLFPTLVGDAYPASRFVTPYLRFSFTIFFVIWLAWLLHLSCKLIASTNGPILILDKHGFVTCYSWLKGNVATVALFVGYAALLYRNVDYYNGEIIGWYAEVHTEELLDNFRLNPAFIGETMRRDDFRFFPLAHQDLHLLSWFTPYVKIWALVSALELFVIVYFATKLVADPLGKKVPFLLLVAASLFLLHESTVHVFFKLHYSERMLVFFFALFLFAYQRYLTTEAPTYYYLTLLFASFGVFFKDTAFILFATPPFLATCVGAVSRYRRDCTDRPLGATIRYLSQTFRLEITLISMFLVCLLLYLALSFVPSLAAGSGAYKAEKIGSLAAIDGSDIRIWLILLVVVARGVSVVAGKARANILDGANASALLYVLAFSVLGHFESYSYRLLPVYFVALLNILWLFRAAHKYCGSTLSKPALGVTVIALFSLGLLGYEYKEGHGFVDVVYHIDREQTSWRDTLGAAKALITQKVLAGEEVNLIYTKSWFDSERHLNRLRYQRLIYLDPDDRSYLVKDGTGRGAAYEPRKGDILINIDEKDLDFLGDELSKYDVIYEFDKGLGNGKLFAYR